MDARVADATDRLADLERALHDLAQIRGRHTTPDGLITALVDGHGALIELHLAETITTLPGPRDRPDGRCGLRRSRGRGGTTTRRDTGSS